jgi:hypothetical protein
MEDRDRDKISKNTGSTSSNIGQKKSDSSAEFGKKVGRSDDIEHEPSRRSDSGSSGMQSDSGRSSGSSGLDSSSDQGEGGVRYRGGNRGGTTEEL